MCIGFLGRDSPLRLLNIFRIGAWDFNVKYDFSYLPIKSPRLALHAWKRKKSSDKSTSTIAVGLGSNRTSNRVNVQRFGASNGDADKLNEMEGNDRRSGH